MITISTWTVGVILTIITLAFVVLGFAYGRSDAAKRAAREQTKDLIDRMQADKEIGTQLGIINTQLATISKQNGGFDARLCGQEKDVKDQLERIAKTESSTAQAHHRLDDHGRRIESLEKQHMKGE
jgi:septal ring factor EnvC (AmiA/AmiB activator)